MADRHPQTGEWIPSSGFPRLPEPDGRELRQTLAAASILGVVPPHMSTLAKRHNLTVFAAKTGPGPESHFYLLEELLNLKAQRAGYRALAEGEANPTEFKLKTPRD